ncbi:CoA-binding protein [Lottiidibacillus patelloidae]|uniref:CoA-binding protein n=1 Tax=Lottiidibacillus patelloidae TaxID=2670334 RepID=A0A263BUI6_9BACI|nr:CoA-binding protein [Lottiidibacillus patelloidae]OZM57403.1 CoA-binding protein [Lottiidibacillus patelloidae]
MTIENPSRDEIGEILRKKKTIAVVGLSDDPTRTSYMVSEAMQRSGYEIIPVNPKAEVILGMKAYNSLSEIDKHIDIVNVFRRSEFVYDITKEAIEIGADVLWTQLGVIDEKAFELAKEQGMIVIMDRCIKVEHALTK